MVLLVQATHPSSVVARVGPGMVTPIPIPDGQEYTKFTIKLTLLGCVHINVSELLA
jgi:hypothetical protein